MKKANFSKVSSFIKVVAHPQRLAILELLYLKNKCSVKNISETLNCEQSYISHHLMEMKLNGILSCEREGRLIFYSLHSSQAVKLLNCINLII